MRKIVLISLCLVGSLFAESIYATFDVKADKSANLAFASSGVVEKVFVDIGDEVKKGDILAQLKNEDLKSALNIAEVTLKYTKIDLSRQTQIQNLIDQSRYDSFKQKYESAKAQVRYQNSLLDKTYLYASFDGVIFSKDIEAGDAVTAGNPKTAFKIQSTNNRKLILEFDQKYFNKVKIGDNFTYKLDGDAKQYTAKISKIYPLADSTSRKIKAEVQAEGILVGLFGDGYIEVK